MMRRPEQGPALVSRPGPPASALVAFLLVAGSSCAALGQSAGTPPSRPSSAEAGTLGDLYRQVERRNPRAAAAQALVRAANARVPGASRPPDPQLQLGFMNYSLPSLVPMEAIGMTQLQVMQMVPLGGKLRLAGRVARSQALATGERARDVVWELRTQAAMSFYDLYATDHQLVVMRQTIRLLQDIARTSEAMYRVGDGRQADVLRARVEIARMTADTTRMAAMRQAMVARLNAIRDVDASVPVETPERPVFPDSIPTVAWLDVAGAEGRPMIRAGLAIVHASQAAAELARKEIFPDLQVGVQYGQRSGTMKAPGGAAEQMPERVTERMGSLMIGASIPIFARDRQFQMRSETIAMRTMAEADVAAMRADTRARIGEVHATIVRSRTLARLYHTTVLPQADATVSSAMAAYRTGSVNFMTLLDGRMAVNRFRQELSAFEADEGKGWAELEMLIGRELLDADTTTGARAVAKLPLPPAAGGVQ